MAYGIRRSNLMKSRLRNFDKLREEINGVNWAQFDGPSSYDSKVVSLALIELMELDSPEFATNVGRRVTYAIGNDHAGVYYPAVLKALDFIIDIVKNTQSEPCRICAKAILNNLYYFEPMIEGYQGCSEDELEEFVKDRLEPYSDENKKNNSSNVSSI